MAVIITGMHRSGTSMVAQWAAESGLSMGNGPTFDTDAANPRGLYERRDVVAFDDAWLADLGGCWWAPPFVTEERWRALDDHRLEAARGELDLFDPDQKRWFVKDPRLALLLPLWDRLCLRRLPVVVVVRPPREVAMSLHVRNGMTLRRGLALWVAYNRAVFKRTHQRQVLVLDLPATLAEPEAAQQVLREFVSGDTGPIEVEPGLVRQGSRPLPGYAERLATDLDQMYAKAAALHAVPGTELGNPIEVPDWAEETLAELSGQWRLQTRLRDLESAPQAPQRRRWRRGPIR